MPRLRGYPESMKLLANLLTLTTQKDDSAEAALSGDVDEIPEDLKTEANAPPVTNATEND